MNADFIDSNVFVYLVDDTDDRKRSIAARVVAAGFASGAVISYQVVQETLNVLVGKLAHGPTPSDAEALLRDVLEPLWQVMPSPALFERALQLRRSHQLSFWDCLIIAAALQAGCTRLLTEDLQHGQVIEGVRIENPFL
ncbi:MAG: PIN domain-containing protein [Dehalococcoidia bacterium]